MDDPLQKIFNRISLQKNASLWLSEDDGRLQDRLTFLSQQEETQFRDILGKKFESSCKNDAVADAFARKCTELGNVQAQLACLDRALLFASVSKQAELFRLRQEVMDKGCAPPLSAMRSPNPGDPIPAAPQFLPCVTVTSSDSRGRYLVAAGDIAAGTLIGSDRPVVMMLKKEFAKSHCWNCLEKVRLAFPCRECSDVVFCSPDCVKEAEESYHRYECTRVPVLYWSDFQAWTLCFRALALTRQPESADTGKNTAASLDQLVTHYGSRQFSAPELMKEALVAVFLARWWASASGTAFDIDTAGAAHTTMRAARFNCLEVVWKDDSSKLKVVGWALCPLLSLANHSCCDANYGRVWTGGHTVKAFATRPIRAGEEICDCYGAAFAYRDREERREVHRRYHFQCECRACREDWPTLAEGTKEVKKQTRCKVARELARMLSPGSSSTVHCESLAKLMGEAMQVLKPPNSLLVAAEEKMHLLLWEQESV